MSTHTPGPWSIIRVTSKDSFVYARIGPNGRGSIAYSGVYGPKLNAMLSEEEAIANARLIAAAPDLLTALKSARSRLHDLLDYGPEGEAVAKFCDAAIIKAEG